MATYLYGDRAPSNESFITLGTSTKLDSERVLTPGSGLTGTDGGVGSTYTLDLGALTANWDAGSYKITALILESDQATGTAPLIVASTTLVSNLNADQVDGKDSTDFFLLDGTQVITGPVKATPDEITATNDGVAASVATLNTEVTTNGDEDLDNVTLANGTSGQVKNIYCVVEGHANDTWKITPATMVGGTQITFSGVGEGCTMVYADSEGWVVIANNGGTIA